MLSPVTTGENYQNVCDAECNWLMDVIEIDDANKLLIENSEIRMPHRFFTGRDPILCRANIVLDQLTFTASLPNRSCPCAVSVR